MSAGSLVIPEMSDTPSCQLSRLQARAVFKCTFREWYQFNISEAKVWLRRPVAVTQVRACL